MQKPENHCEESVVAGDNEDDAKAESNQSFEGFDNSIPTLKRSPCVQCLLHSIKTLIPLKDWKFPLKAGVAPGED